MQAGEGQKSLRKGRKKRIVKIMRRDYEAYHPTRNTFYYTPKSEMCGLKLLAYSTIGNEESDAVGDALYCRVCPTIFD